MKFIVTGGSGFIGSHLVAFLVKEGHQVISIDKCEPNFSQDIMPSITIKHANLCDLSSYQDSLYNSDGCFHLAADQINLCENNPIESEKNHILATICLIKGLDKASPKTPLIFTSSAAIYGDKTGMSCFEYMEPNPLSIYGTYKTCCETILNYASLTRPVLIARPFNIYGRILNSQQTKNDVVSSFINNILTKASLDIYGNGQQTRDFIYVEDVIQILVKLFMKIKLDKKRCFLISNVCTGKSLSVLSLAQKIASITNIKPKINFKPLRNYEIRHSLGNTSNLMALLGKLNTSSLDDYIYQEIARLNFIPNELLRKAP